MVSWMKTRYWFKLWIALAIVLSVPAGDVSAAPGPDPLVFEHDAGGLSLRWQAPVYRVQQVVGEDGRAYVLPWTPGWLLTADPGAPQLPYATAVVSLPPEGEPQIQVKAGEQRAYPLPALPYPAPAPQQQSAAQLQERGALTRWDFDADAYAVGSWTPSEVVTLTELGTMRGLRLARLTFYPWRYRHDGQRAWLQITASVDVRITFPDAQYASTARRVPDPLLDTARALVLNPERVHAFAEAPLPALRASGAALPTAAAARFSLRERGVYALPLSLLQSQGIFPDGGDPARIQVTCGSGEIALYWDAAAQQFLFYADPQPTRWADDEVYRVSYGTAQGLRMAVRSSPSLGAGPAWHLAVAGENQHYETRYASPRDGDHWYWGCLDRPASSQCPETASYAITLQVPEMNGPDATLQVWLQGYTAVSASPDHRAAVFLNGHDLGSVTWDGAKPYTATFSVPASYLRSGANEVRISLPGGLAGVDLEGTWVDALALAYPVASMTEDSLHFVGEATPHAYTIGGVSTLPQVYDVTTPETPKRVTGFTWSGGALTLGDDRADPLRYFVTVPSAVRTVAALESVPVLPEPAGADYLVVAPSAWIPALAPLVSLRATEGLSTFVAPVEAVYAAYGDDRMDPEAIRAFVAHAYAVWSPRPAYLLLVGDGTWDPLNYLGTGTATWMPPYLAEADPWLGEVPADNRYVSVDGADTLPDLAVGRLPVNSISELDAAVSKIVAYETASPPGDWNTRHLFVADDPETLYDFPAEAAKVMPLVPVTHTTTLLSCSDDPSNPDSSFCGDVASTRAHLLAAWNSGALAVNWVGHSSWQQWEHNRLFHTDDLPLLTNSNRLPVVIEMTCFTGNFAHPDPLQTAMDESLVRFPGAGAVAAWGSSGEGLGTHNTPLHKAFYQASFGGSGGNLGDAMTSAKLSVAGGWGGYMVDTYHYFGDPALSWHLQVVPWTAQVHLPLIFKNN